MYELDKLSTHCYTKDHKGEISFATDVWTSPNHKALIAITAHMEHKGAPLRFLLNVVEVPVSHSGANLAAAFAEVVDAFHATMKVNNNLENIQSMTHRIPRLLQ